MSYTITLSFAVFLFSAAPLSFNLCHLASLCFVLHCAASRPVAPHRPKLISVTPCHSVTQRDTEWHRVTHCNTRCVTLYQYVTLWHPVSPVVTSFHQVSSPCVVYHMLSLSLYFTMHTPTCASMYLLCHYAITLWHPLSSNGKCLTVVYVHLYRDVLPAI